MDARPGGPASKREPSPEGPGINPEDDLSAGGAALNLGPLAPVSLGRKLVMQRLRGWTHQTFGVLWMESRSGNPGR